MIRCGPCRYRCSRATACTMGCGSVASSVSSVSASWPRWLSSILAATRRSTTAGGDLSCSDCAPILPARLVCILPSAVGSLQPHVARRVQRSLGQFQESWQGLGFAQRGQAANGQHVHAPQGHFAGQAAPATCRASAHVPSAPTPARSSPPDPDRLGLSVARAAAPLVEHRVRRVPGPPSTEPGDPGSGCCKRRMSGSIVASRPGSPFCCARVMAAAARRFRSRSGRASACSHNGQTCVARTAFPRPASAAAGPDT